MAQLFGQMKAKTASHIGIDDIEPRVFRAKLHFVYTDSLLDMDSGGDALAVAQHLVVAADKYGTERLKLICEDRPCDCINTVAAATTMELAEQYGSRRAERGVLQVSQVSRKSKGDHA
jgi:speckle-type POZ protein